MLVLFNVAELVIVPVLIFVVLVPVLVPVVVVVPVVDVVDVARLLTVELGIALVELEPPVADLEE